MCCYPRQCVRKRLALPHVRNAENGVFRSLPESGAAGAEYDIASLYMVSFYCFVTKACDRRPGAAASVERWRRERRTVPCGRRASLSRSDTLAASQTFERMHCTFSAPA
jgi:hypothetical protein